MTPRVSIVIPTWNGGPRLERALDAIASQRFEAGVEIVAIDSGSTDGSLELLARRADRLIRIDPAGFNHGRSRNDAIRQARGELVVLLVQDAVPADERWLAALTAPFEGRPLLAGTFARQLPAPGTGPIARHHLALWVASTSTPRRSRLSDRSELDALDPMERLRRCAFDNVCSCIRRSVWERLPFPEATMAEDLEWARDVLLSGYELAYLPEARVEHAHERSARYELARTYLCHRRLFELFGLRTIPSAAHLIPAVATSLRDHVRCLAADRRLPGARELWRALALACVLPAGQYLGGLSAARGWRPWRLGRV